METFRSFSQYIYTHAVSHPNDILIVDNDGDRSITGKEFVSLTQRIISLAKKRKYSGVIPVILSRGYEFVSAVIALNLLGLGVAPLSSSYPKSRVDDILEQLKTNSVVDLDFINEAKEESPYLENDFILAEDEIAFIYFTSGSTGKPKGVIYKNSTCLELIKSWDFIYLFDTPQCVASTSSFSFIVSNFNVFAALYFKNILHIISEEVKTDIFKIREYIRKHSIDSIYLAPTLAKILGNDFPSLKQVLCAGERMSGIDKRNYEVINLYGASEVEVVTYFVVDKSYENTPIGKPVKHKEVFILDENGNLSNEGELCIKGTISDGYFNNDTLNKEKFIDSPKYGKYFRSGDLVKLDEDNNLIYLNRLDYMVKISGQRVEPGEIEVCLASYFGINKAAVKAFCNADGNNFLVGYYESENEIKATELKHFLNDKLPSYMVPSFFVHYKKLPLNTNGKLDRLSLLPPNIKSFQSEYVAPKNEVEKRICQAFETVLHIDSVGVNDDFFSLGGDSLTTISLLTNLSEYNLSTIDILEAKTPLEISRKININDKKCIKTRRSKVHPLNSSQLGVYLACTNDLESTKYNIPFYCNFKNLVTEQELENAILKMIETYSIFKVCFIEIDGQVQMREIDPYIDINISHLNIDEFEDFKNSFIKPFDFIKGNLSRFRIVNVNNDIYLFADIHHIVFDGTSLSLFLSSLTSLLKGKKVEEKVSIFDLNDDEVDSSKLEEAKKYFSEQLSNDDFENDIPHVNSVVEKENCAATYTTFIDSSVSNLDVSSFVKKNKISESTLFLSCFTYALAKMSNSEGFCLSSVNSGRHSVLESSCLGMFVKTLPLCLKVDEEQTNIEYLKYIEKTFYNSIKYDYYPYQSLINEFGFNYPIYFVYQNETISSINYLDNDIEIIQLPIPEAISNISFHVLKKYGSYQFIVNYQKSIYDQKTIETLISLLTSTLKGFINDIETRKIDLLTSKDKASLRCFNDVEEVNNPPLVLESFFDVVKKYSGLDALVYQNERLTYCELDMLSDNIARFLIKKGIKKGDVVSILTSRNLNMVIAPLAVIKAGAIYQPLDSSYPVERLTYMIKDSNSKLLLVSSELIDYLEVDIPTFDLEDLKKESSSNIDFPKIDKNDGFSLLYTSGTTGKPKGILISHNNIATFISSYRKIFDFSSSSKLASYASFGFDANMMDVFVSLSSGATNYIIPLEMRLDIGALNQYITKNDVSHLFLTTQIGRQFYLTQETSSLKYLLVGGETLYPFELNRSYTIYNLYGPSETTVVATFFKVDQKYTNIPIGKAFGDFKMYVADKYLRALPPLAVGELVLCGPQVSSGYINNLEKTKQNFINNPFEENKHYQNAYKTGDIVRFLADGNIEFVGRKDNQVKVRGFRIELSEIEEVISRFPNINQAVVVGLNAEGGGKYLVSYFTSNEKINIEELKEFIKKEKPSYMVPEINMQIPSLPLNQNGKVNKKLLPTPKREVKEFVLPRNDSENKIYSIISTILNHHDFGVKDDLFEVGVNSITSVKITSSLSKEFSTNITSLMFKENPTIEKLSLILSNLKVKTYQKLEYYPLSQSQLGVYFESISSPNSLIYNIPYLYKLGDVDVLKVKTSICKVISAHPYLLSTFFLKEEGIVCRRNENNFDINEINDIEVNDIDSIKSELVKPFSFEKGRLFRISIIKTKQANYLFLDFHHIIFDGTSLSIFLNDLNSSYQGNEILLEKFTCYEYCLEEKQLRESASYQKAKEYYLSTFSSFEGVSLPLSDLILDETGFSYLSHTFYDLDLSNINKYLKKHNFTENNFFIACFGYLLSTFNNESEALFTSIYNGRNNPLLTNSIAMYVKTYPVYTDSKIDNCVDFIKAVSKQTNNSINNDLFSFIDIKNELGFTSDIMFVYQGTGFLPSTLFEEHYEEVNLGLSQEKATIAFEVKIVKDKLSVEVNFDKGKYSSDFIKSFVLTYGRIVKQIIECSSLKDIDLLDEEEINLLDEYHGKDSFNPTLSVVDYFNESAKKHPSKIALTSKNTSLTYLEVDDLSSRLAFKLIELGVKNNDIVAVLSSRGIDMLISPLGVLKARATYQPLDSSYPKERLTFMVKDSKAKVLISPKNLVDLVDTDIETIYFDDVSSFSLPSKPLKSPSLDDGFSILYTSGSTGLPKGCLLTHRNLVYMINNNIERFKVDESSRFASYASFGFDANMMEMFTPICIGGSVFIIPLEIRLELFKIKSFFDKYKITHASMTTQIGKEFYSSFECLSLRYLMLGGEALSPIDTDKSYKILNAYGPTEATVYVTCFEVDRKYKVIPIGKSNFDTKLYIVDSSLRRLPRYSCGELVISGPQVGSGYLSRDELNRKIFIKNPFSLDPKYQKSYRTGDIVRFIAEGNIQFIGRKDSQVKIRGFRIELSEVEDIIKKFDKVKDCRVLAYNETSGGKYLCAYIIAEVSINTSSLIQFIKDNKPSYMVPKSFIQLDKFPLTQNQKLDKKALPMPKDETPFDFVAPSNALEEEIAIAMGEVLGITMFSSTASFFDMGGSSILASKLLLRLLKKDLVVSYSDIFSYSSPKELANYLSNQIKKSHLENSEDEIELYDYQDINKYLSSFSIKKIDEEIATNPDVLNGHIGHLFLTGATGFLGCHVLKHFLTSYSGKVYCLLRGESVESVTRKLKARLGYYFFDDFKSCFESGRVICINGTLSDKNLYEKVKDLDFNTIINCAALVKHFTNDDSLYIANTLGVRNLLDIVKKKKVRFIQTSTYSVSGYENETVKDRIFKETDLYVGQTIDNEYIRTKFLAERDCIIASKNGHFVKVLRLGNLMPRIDDNEFQINFLTNGFMRDIRGVTALGCVPLETLHNTVDMSPIDETSIAVLKIADSNLSLPVYNVYNDYKIHLKDIVEGIRKCGFNIDIVSDKTYRSRIKDAINSVDKTSDQADILTGLMAYKDAKTGKEPVSLKVDNSLTIQTLYRLSYSYSIINQEYVSFSIKNLMKLRFFDKNNKF